MFTHSWICVCVFVYSVFWAGGRVLLVSPMFTRSSPRGWRGRYPHTGSLRTPRPGPPLLLLQQQPVRAGSKQLSNNPLLPLHLLFVASAICFHISRWSNNLNPVCNWCLISAPAAACEARSKQPLLLPLFFVATLSVSKPKYSSSDFGNFHLLQPVVDKTELLCREAPATYSMQLRLYMLLQSSKASNQQNKLAKYQARKQQRYSVI